MSYYTYLIGWSKHNKWYYGARWSDKAQHNDLWKTYFTSSNYVKQFKEEYGEPDIIQVRKTFTDKQECQKWEATVLRKLNVINNDKWLNKTVAGKLPPVEVLWDNPKTKEKFLKARRSIEHRKRVSLTMKSHHHKMKLENYDEYVLDQSRRGKGLKKNGDNYVKGAAKRLADPNFSKRLSKACKGIKKKTVMCPHCNKEGGRQNMMRYHFDNCKLLNTK